ATAIRMRASSEHDPEKWEPVFGKGSCSTKELVYPLNASTLPSPGRNSGLPDLRGTTAEPGQAWLPSEGASGSGAGATEYTSHTTAPGSEPAVSANPKQTEKISACSGAIP